jgi:hypothetical protein
MRILEAQNAPDDRDEKDKKSLSDGDNNPASYQLAESERSWNELGLTKQFVHPARHFLVEAPQ